MGKRVTPIGRRKRRDIATVKKSLRNYVDIVINSGNEDLIRMMEGAFDKVFKALVEPKDLRRKRGEVVPIRGRKKDHQGE
jgi:hypothetical protein